MTLLLLELDKEEKEEEKGEEGEQIKGSIKEGKTMA